MASPRREDNMCKKTKLLKLAINRLSKSHAAKSEKVEPKASFIDTGDLAAP